MDFSVLRTKPIIGILIGDVELFEDNSLPYLIGTKLCELSTQLGPEKLFADIA
jgi:hypothetical protein